jgi:hypothetical protein
MTAKLIPDRTNSEDPGKAQTLPQSIGGDESGKHEPKAAVEGLKELNLETAVRTADGRRQTQIEREISHLMRLQFIHLLGESPQPLPLGCFLSQRRI